MSSQFAGLVQDNLQDLRGNAMVGAVVRVRTVGTTTPAVVYDNAVEIASASGGDLLVNDATTGLSAASGLLLPGVDANANYTFFADSDLEYDLHVTWQGQTFDYRVQPKVVRGGSGAVSSVDGQTGAVDLSDTYAPIAEVDDRIAGDAALDVRVDALETGGGYDPNAVTVLRFTGQVAVHVNHGPFWPLDVDLGHFYWDAWMVNNDGYVISDGSGGGHCLLWGGLRSGTTVGVTGNMWDGNTPLVTFGSDDTTDQTEWAHHAVGWDGSYIYYWIDGLLCGVVAYTRARRAQYGQLYVAGSDHQNFTGKLSQLRGFEDSFPTTQPHLGFVPERYLSPFDQLGNTASFLANYMVPGQVIIPDLSDGYNGRVHPGAIHAGPNLSGHIAISSGAFAGVPEVPGRPSWEVDATAPFDVAAAVVPTGAIAAIPALPAGADTYDSYNRAKQNNNMVAPTLGTTDARASLGAQTWLYGLTGDGRESRWGIANGRAVCLFAQGAAREIAWVPRTAAGPGMDVRVDRRGGATYGTHDTGLAIRVANNLNHYAVVTRGDASPTGATVSVYKNLAGNLSVLGSTLACPATEWTTLRAVMPTGSNVLTVYVDDLGSGWTQIGQLTGLTDHSTAKGAGNANYHLSTLARHDNFRVLAA